MRSASTILFKKCWAQMVKTITEHPVAWLNAELGIGQANWDHAECLALGQTQMHRLFPTIALVSEKSSDFSYSSESCLNLDELAWPDPLRPARLIDTNTFLNRRLFNDGLIVLQGRQCIHESYRNGFTAKDRHVIHSCTKSFCSFLIAQAVAEGKLDPYAPIQQYVSELQSIAAWEGVTLEHVWDMQAGILYSEDYSDPDAHYWSYAKAAGYYPAGKDEAIGIRAWVSRHLTERQTAPGTAFLYNSTLTNILGMALETVYGQSLGELFEQRLYRHCGAEQDAWFNTDREGFPIVEGQLNLTLKDFAKLAYPLINKGKSLSGVELVPSSFISSLVKVDQRQQAIYQANETDMVFSKGQYQKQFWVLEPETQCFTMLGIHGQFAWCDLQHQILIVGVGSYPRQDGTLMMTTLRQLWHTIRDKIIQS